MSNSTLMSAVLFGLFLYSGTFLNVKGNPEEGNMFQGDMVLTEEQEQQMNQRGVHAFDVRRWPDAVLVYALEDTFSEVMRDRISGAMQHWSENTCVTFREKTDNDQDYVQIIDDTANSCWSYVGRINGAQNMNIGIYCSEGNIIHEIGHALGLFHEQSRPDRDDFVTIMWENIIDGRSSNFRKISPTYIDSLGCPYDYGSIMHYGEKFFSKNGLQTIIPKQAGAVIGQRVGLSEGDIKQAKLMYPCCRDNWENCSEIDALGICWGRTQVDQTTLNDVVTNCKETCGLCCACSQKQCKVPFSMDDSCWAERYVDVDDRLFNEMILNKRNEMDWTNWETWMRNFVCDCAKATQAKGWTYFSIQFYGECWSGPGVPNYKRGGTSKCCWDTTWDKCTAQIAGDKCCFGGALANKVYKIIENQDFDTLCG